MIIFTYTKNIYNDKGLKKARIFFLRSLLYFNHVINWLKFIDSFYKKYCLNSAPSDLAGLPIRSYVSNIFNIRKRITFLKNHYQIMEEIFSPEAIKELLSEKNDKIIISSIFKKNGEPCYLKILMHGKFWREGAMTIYLTDENHKLITTLTFTISYDSIGKKSIFIGGLQGGSGAEKSDIVNFTRSLGGLRPKHALIECCYSIASLIGAETIIGVSNKNHVFSYQKTFQKSYDEIWKEIGSTIMKDENYLLPKSLEKRNFEDVPQKKRKDWLIRHGHLEKLNSDISNFLNKNSKK
jgi:hypothetical protein